jgi:terminase small subunit / prophage DNA-packing protein
MSNLDDFESFLSAPQMGVERVATVCGGDVLANALGLSTRRIAAMVKEGTVIKRARDSFDWVLSVQNYLAKQRPESNSKDRLTSAQADLAELKLAEAKGELLPASQIETEWGGIVRDATAAILGVTAKVQGRLGHLSNHDAAVIDSEIRLALTALGESHV